MKQHSIHATSIYSLILVTSLMVYSVEQSSVISILFLFPGFVYFLLRVMHIYPPVGRLFFQRKSKYVEMICGMYVFLFSTVILIANTFNIRSVIQMILCLFILPVTTHFLLRLSMARVRIARKKEALPLHMPTADVVPLVEVNEVKEKERRMFLKMLLGAGVGIVVASVLNPKKASAAFFGSVPGPGVVGVKNSTGAAINPSEKSPTDGYGVSNLDTGSYPAYFGFINKDGGWYIMRENPQSTFMYSKGDANFSTNWTGRAGLTYDTFDVIFS